METSRVRFHLFFSLSETHQYYFELVFSGHSNGLYLRYSLPGALSVALQSKLRFFFAKLVPRYEMPERELSPRGRGRKDQALREWCRRRAKPIEHTDSGKMNGA
jgi:hypothetical protein